MTLTAHYTVVRTASQRTAATSYMTTKQFARDLAYFFNQVQQLSRRAETDTRRFLNNLKPFEDKD
jgi:hypothetical protein